MRAAIALALLTLAGCGREKSVTDKTAEDFARDHPVGSYQMMANPGGDGFLLLNTKTGTVQHCKAGAGDIECSSSRNP